CSQLLRYSPRELPEAVRKRERIDTQDPGGAAGKSTVRGMVDGGQAAGHHPFPGGGVSMSHTGRIMRNIAIGLAGLIVALILVAVVVVQTNWFRNYVRETIVTAVDNNVGGRAEIGSFEFDPKSLHAVVRNFVIHGNE